MSASTRWRRPTIRLRLTLLYGGAFFLAGAVLVGVMYVILGEALDRQVTDRVGITEHLPEPASTEPSAQQQAHEAQEALRAQFEQDRDDTLDTMLVASLVALGAVGVVAVGAGWLLAGRALHPLHRITATARRVVDRNLHERIALDGPDDEIKDLADTFDAMLERLDRSFDSQRRFVANASHELRTPLTLTRTLIEVALDDPAADGAVRRLGDTLLSVNRRHERLIDGLLTLASTDQGVTERVAVDLADVAGHVLDENRTGAATADVELHSQLETAVVSGDPLLLERLAHNLIDNAIRYNHAGGEVIVSTATVDGVALLAVENSGPVVPPYAVPGLFEPFRRLEDTDRLAVPSSTSNPRGAGLGLSIVRSVAHAHGGDVSATPRDGGGLVVRVHLPALVEAAPTGDPRSLSPS
jgi:signal transduction histidine kinase